LEKKSYGIELVIKYDASKLCKNEKKKLNEFVNIKFRLSSSKNVIY